MASTAAFLERLCAPGGAADDTRVLLVVAHPDDDVIGAGTRLPRLPQARVLFVTDGAPADMAYASRLGIASKAAYAATRAREAEAALALVGVDASRIGRLGLADQEASLDMGGLARRLAAAFRESSPEVVLTHPYEGGHPDHDATALAVRLACRLLRDGGEPPPDLAEFAGYHAGGWRGMRMQEFLPGGTELVVTARLDRAERALKRRLLACHATQRGILRLVPLGRERFRTAPAYDFRAPPHRGRPFYETFQQAVTGERWLRLAAETLAAFGATEPL